MPSPNLAWFKEIKFETTDTSSGIVLDQAGNLYISGFQNPHKGGSTFSFLEKIDPLGTPLWRENLFGPRGSTGDDLLFYMVSSGITRDHLGNIYVAGGIGAGEQQGGADAFLAKFDSQGKGLWLKQIETEAYDFAFAITSDHLGHVIIFGLSEGHGGSFLTKFNQEGEIIWKRDFKLFLDHFNQNFATDPSGNIFVSGLISGYLLLRKYNSDGHQDWTKKIRTEKLYDWITEGAAQAIATDREGNIFVSGWIEPKEHHRKAFLAKFDQQGDQLWFKQIEEKSGGSEGLSISINKFGDIFLLGGSNDGLFWVKFDQNGSQLYMVPSGRKEIRNHGAIAVDDHQNVFICGEMVATEEFGGQNIFIAKYEDGPSISQHHHFVESKLVNLSNTVNELKLTQTPFELDLALIQAARDRTQGKGGGRISQKEANEIIVQAQSDGKISEKRKRTLAYIYAMFSLTNGAKIKIIEALG